MTKVLAESGDVQVVETGYVEKRRQVRRLLIAGQNWMEDSQAERVLCNAIERMSGHVLHVGLGLGFMFEIAAKVPAITRQSVLEVNPDVVKLIQVPAGVQVYQGDAWTWEPPAGLAFDCVWLDMFWKPREGDQRERLAARFAKWTRDRVFCFPYGEVSMKGEVDG